MGEGKREGGRGRGSRGRLMGTGRQERKGRQCTV